MNAGHDRGDTEKAGKAKDLFEFFWETFCSLKLTIFLIIAISLSMVMGTFVPQTRLADPGAMARFRESLPPLILKTSDFFELFDLFGSWWFLLLLLLFALNLLACSLERIPRALRSVSSRRCAEQGQAGSARLRRELRADAPGPELSQVIAEALGRQFSRPVSFGDPVHTLFAQKHVLGRFGAYIVHLSILIVLAGAIIGSIFGYQGKVEIPEGGSVDHFFLQERSGFTVKRGLPFKVRCDRFAYETFAGGRPKDYRSDLSIEEDGRVVAQKTIEVNDPFTFRGITFYQSSYRPNPEGGFFSLSVRDRETGASREFKVKPGEEFPAADEGSFYVVKDYSENFMGMGPSMLLSKSLAGKEELFRVFKDFPAFDEKNRTDRFVVTLSGAKISFYTGLQVAHHSGIWVIWLGTVLSMLGLSLAFFMSHRRIWVFFRDDSIVVTGRPTRQTPAFEREFDRVADAVGAALTCRAVPEKLSME